MIDRKAAKTIGVRVDERPSLLLTTPRTGSWPVYQLLSEYFRKTTGSIGLQEFFSMGGPSFGLQDGKIVCYPAPSIPSFEDVERSESAEGTEKLKDLIIVRRSEMLKASSGRYFFKVFSDQIVPANAAWLADNYQWIFLERRDLFSQLLSFLISVNTHVFYEAGGIKVGVGSLEAGEHQMRHFEGLIWNYLLFKRNLKPKQRATYEDFCEKTRPQFLELIELDGSIDLSYVSVREKQNKGIKEEAFSNFKEIRKWYKQSYLNDLSPLR